MRDEAAIDITNVVVSSGISGPREHANIGEFPTYATFPSNAMADLGRHPERAEAPCTRGAGRGFLNTCGKHGVSCGAARVGKEAIKGSYEFRCVLEAEGRTTRLQGSVVPAKRSAGFAVALIDALEAEE